MLFIKLGWTNVFVSFGEGMVFLLNGAEGGVG